MSTDPGLFQWPSLNLAILAVLNGGLSAGDILGILLVVFQVRRGAVVRNQGWRTYWKPKEPAQP